MSRVGTCVVGAGPAGLLFCIAARLLQEREGPGPALAPLWLIDKRLKYERNHRMRLGEEPYRQLAADLGDPRFDALLRFLEEQRFSVEVNALESRLLEIATQLGIQKEHLALGTGPGELDLGGLRGWLEKEGRLSPEDPLCVVGADSVRSTVRELAPPGTRTIERTHQHLTRLKLVGPQLPESIGVVDQFKLSKILSSLLDYRLNAEGHAEVDLFLAAQEHLEIAQLGASPRAPVLLTREVLKPVRAPLFVRMAERLRQGLGGGECQVWLQSTFKLEHRYVERPTFELAGKTRVLLIGDAAVSLPFQRGMACLARCVQSLAHAHHEWVGLQLNGTSAEAPIERYVQQVREARETEMKVVTARARLVTGVREFIRVSSLLPFPLQTWLLSEAQKDSRPTRFNLTFWLNLGLATASLATGTTSLALANWIAPDWSWLWLAAVPLQLAGGASYGSAQVFEGGSDRLVRGVWRVQVLTMAVFGAVIAVASHAPMLRALAALSWFALAVPFVLGLYVFEGVERRWWKAAEIP